MVTRPELIAAIIRTNKIRLKHKRYRYKLSIADLTEESRAMGLDLSNSRQYSQQIRKLAEEGLIKLVIDKGNQSITYIALDNKFVMEYLTR